MRQLVCVSVRPWVLGFSVLVFVLWASLEADRVLFEKDETEFYAETFAAFCAVTIHLVIEAWLHAGKRWVRKVSRGNDLRKS